MQDNPAGFERARGFFPQEPVRGPTGRYSEPIFSSTPSTTYARNPGLHHATVHSVPFPSLPEAILDRRRLQRGAHECHPLDDSRLLIGDRRRCHAPLDQAVGVTPTRGDGSSPYFFVDDGVAAEADFLGSATTVDSSNAFGSNLLGHAKSSSELTICMS